MQYYFSFSAFSEKLNVAGKDIIALYISFVLYVELGTFSFPVNMMEKIYSIVDILVSYQQLPVWAESYTISLDDNWIGE